MGRLLLLSHEISVCLSDRNLFFHGGVGRGIGIGERGGLTMTAANAVLSFNVRMKDTVSHAKWGKDGVCLHDHTPATSPQEGVKP